MSVCDLDQWIRETVAEPMLEPIPLMLPARPRRALPRRPGERRGARR